MRISTIKLQQLQKTGIFQKGMSIFKSLLGKILSSNFSIFKPISQSLMVANGETVEIIGQVVIPIRIGKDMKHMGHNFVSDTYFFLHKEKFYFICFLQSFL